MAKKDTSSKNASASKSQEADASKSFKAFSDMDMSSLWDANKTMNMHRKNMDTVKQTHGVMSEVLKEVSSVHAQAIHKKVAKMKSSIANISDKMKNKDAVREHMNHINQQHQALAEKVKMSKDKALNAWQEKVEEIKGHHAKLMDKLNQHKHQHAENLKSHADEAKAHHAAVSESWKNSTLKIMDLMKNTANSHMNTR